MILQDPDKVKHCFDVILMQLDGAAFTELEITLVKNGRTNHDVPLISVDGDCYLEIIGALKTSDFNVIKSMINRIRKKAPSVVTGVSK